MIPNNKARINITIPKDIYKAFKDACYWERITMTDVLSKAIDNTIKRSSKKKHD